MNFSVLSYPRFHLSVFLLYCYCTLLEISLFVYHIRFCAFCLSCSGLVYSDWIERIKIKINALASEEISPQTRCGPSQ